MKGGLTIDSDTGLKVEVSIYFDLADYYSYQHKGDLVDTNADGKVDRNDAISPEGYDGRVTTWIDAGFKFGESLGLDYLLTKVFGSALPDFGVGAISYDFSGGKDPYLEPVLIVC